MQNVLQYSVIMIYISFKISKYCIFISQKNDSSKMYHCAARTSDVHSVPNIADMTLPEGHITVAQLLQTVSDGMDQNRDTTQKNRYCFNAQTLVHMYILKE